MNKELSIESSAETRGLYTQILTEEGAGSYVALASQHMNREQVLRQLGEANRTIDLVKAQIQQTLQALDRYSDAPNNIVSVKLIIKKSTKHLKAIIPLAHFESSLMQF